MNAGAGAMESGANDNFISKAGDDGQGYNEDEGLGA